MDVCPLGHVPLGHGWLHKPMGSGDNALARCGGDPEAQDSPRRSCSVTSESGSRQLGGTGRLHRRPPPPGPWPPLRPLCRMCRPLLRPSNPWSGGRSPHTHTKTLPSLEPQGRCIPFCFTHSGYRTPSFRRLLLACNHELMHCCWDYVLLCVPS